MSSNIQNNSSQNIVHGTNVQGQKKEHDIAIYSLILDTLLSSFSTQLRIAKMQSESQQQNSLVQETIIDQMDQYKLQDIDKSAWEQVTEKVYDHTEKHHNPTDGSWDYEDIYRYETKTKLVKPEIIDAIQQFNQQQIKLQQDDQANLSILKQSGQLSLASSSSTVQAATMSCTAWKEVLDTMAAASRKISKMKG